jgi:hypothetical protein
MSVGIDAQPLVSRQSVEVAEVTRTPLAGG